MLRKYIPPKLKSVLGKYIEPLQLKFSPVRRYNIENLRSTSAEELKNIWYDHNLSENWNSNKEKIDSFQLPEMTGGINSGDQRAIFYLISYLKPKNVLEIGTHIGCSTINIGLALKSLENFKITCVDIIDVNEENKKRWLQFGSKYSPKQLLAQIGITNQAEFIQMNSIEYLKTCNTKFDFIFLDGSHRAIDVYKEIVLALQLLDKNGAILLHDYYPDSKPIWYDNVVIAGPVTAVKRLKKECEGIDVCAFSRLPWETRFNSFSTSLALLTRKK
jgi:predicted O-methyltransferase YrrM